MSATATMRSELRRMCALASSDTTYTDDVLDAYIETHPLVDAAGYDPDDASWTAVYDLHAAAARIWSGKAAAIADKFNFSADGGTFSTSQKYEHYMKQSRYHAARRSPGRIWHRVDPRITTNTGGELNE